MVIFLGPVKQTVYQQSCYCWYSCHFYCYGGVAIVVVSGGGIAVVSAAAADVVVVVVVVVVSVVLQPPVRMAYILYNCKTLLAIDN